MIRPRTSRIFYERKLYDYPVSLSLNTMRNIGFRRLTGVGITYLKSKVRPRPNEDSLEDFLINRFGERLYAMFFRDYTTKVWGIEPQHISASWGAQRIKGLSLTKAVAHWARSKARRPGPRDFDQKDTETSLIELFMYPRLGPGQFWETIDDWVTERGVEVRKEVEVVGFDCESGRITGVRVQDAQGSVETIPADEVISSMPIPELVAGLDAEVPAEVRAVASGLPFRDFITVGLLVHRLKIGDPDGSLIPDNWIYVQEPDVRVGRLQIFNNWSPFMVADPEKTVWIGLEYFCNEGDDLWSMSEEDFIGLAIKEVDQLGIADADDVLDSVQIKVAKAYPAYFGTYDRIAEVKAYLDTIENLYCVGRNGQHRYNNQDHSMLTAMEAARMIISGQADRPRLWSINTEAEYHEEK